MKITPTLGRIVWYRGADNVTRSAIVTHVWGDFCLNLQVFAKDQNDKEAGLKTSVTHASPVTEPSCFPSWDWPPQQKTANATGALVQENKYSDQFVDTNYDDSEIDIEQQIEAKVSSAKSIPVPTFAEDSLPFCPHNTINS